jgi:hypothetical protein
MLFRWQELTGLKCYSVDVVPIIVGRGPPEEIRTPDLRIRRLVPLSEVRTVVVCDFCSGSKPEILSASMKRPLCAR